MKAIGVSRPHPREIVSGDGWLSIETANGLRVGLADGAGHGALAAEASSAALAYISESQAEPLPAVLQRCHELLRSTRGAVISLADLTIDGVTFAGVGNVDCRIVSPLGQQRLVPQRGLLGVALPRIRVESIPVPSSQFALLMHSDGVSQRMTMDWQQIATVPTDDLLRTALAEWGRATDDATLVLAFVGVDPR